MSVEIQCGPQGSRKSRRSEQMERTGNWNDGGGGVDRGPVSTGLYLSGLCESHRVTSSRTRTVEGRWGTSLRNEPLCRVERVAKGGLGSGCRDEGRTEASMTSVVDRGDRHFRENGVQPM